MNMYRTDKQFMKNPATATSRIYIGSLSKTTVADDLENVFKKHGNITGMSLNSGFAFIQFEHEHEAHEAIQAENGLLLNGRKIIVKQALDKSKGGNQGGGVQRGPMQKPSFGNSGPFGGGGNAGPPPLLKTPDNPPPARQPTPPPTQVESTRISFEEPDVPEDNIEDDCPNIRPPPGPNNQFNDDKLENRNARNRRRGRGGRGGPGPHGQSNERFDRFADGPPPPQRDIGMARDLRFEPPEPYRGGRDSYGYGRDKFGLSRIDTFGPPPGIEAPPPAVEKNDCEIIVVSKTLTEYAEFIEAKLKNLGLIVDLLFPNEDVPIGKVLANISSRGCLYAILVMPINEEHRSLTLNILHGTPQEHRNMPVEDALILLSHNFEAYMKGQHLPPENPTQMKLEDRHPTSMQMLINLLADNRQLTTTQYDNLIEYLQQRKKLQHEFEVEEGIAPSPEEADPKQAELQNRILNILNKTSESSIPTSITAPDSSVATEAPILKDPTVQKALDSLMLGDMLKNIAAV